MPQRVNKTVLVGLIVVLVLSIALTASAQLAEDPAVPAPEDVGQAGPPVGPPMGGAADQAVAVGESQLGMPFEPYGADGPGVFSCSGLMRYILRETGVDPNAPWVPEEYLSRYAPVAPGDMRPGDIVIYPDWATMFVGDGMLLNANMITGDVTHTPMEFAGEPLGVVRPYAS